MPQDEVQEVAKRLNCYAKVVPYFVAVMWLLALIMVVVTLNMVFTWK